MRCYQGACSLQGVPGCAGQKCTSDRDCLSCNGTCQAGYCRVTSNNCSTTTCFTDSDCTASGLNSCVSGCCQ
jgi:hypothetical protein